MLEKIIRYAKKMGMDEEELLDMTVLDAILAIEDIQFMWAELINNAE
jgi:hypothetical protein